MNQDTSLVCAVKYLEEHCFYHRLQESFPQPFILLPEIIDVFIAASLDSRRYNPGIPLCVSLGLRFFLGENRVPSFVSIG